MPYYRAPSAWGVAGEAGGGCAPQPFATSGAALLRAVPICPISSSKRVRQGALAESSSSSAPLRAEESVSTGMAAVAPQGISHFVDTKASPVHAPKVVTAAPQISSSALRALYALFTAAPGEVWFSEFGSNVVLVLGRLHLALYVVRLYDAPTRYWGRGEPRVTFLARRPPRSPKLTRPPLATDP